MKWLKYKINNPVNFGTVESPLWEDNLMEKGLSYCEANEEIAKKEAYMGEYTVEDDGQPEPVAEPTTDDVLNALLGVMG